jgi:zinc D-Ala-D-Ala dipeptidase
MKPYQAVPIVECGEPLRPLPDTVALVDPHPYVACGASYGDLSPYCLRATVVDHLAQAQTHLHQHHPGWRLQIFDAYRPVAVQQYMVDYTFRSAARDRGLDPQQLDAAQQEELWQQVYQIWAIPSLNLATPPPHSTGGAVDLTIIDDQGQPLDMGSPIDEMSDRSQPNHFAQDPQGQDFHRHRELLRQVMESAGFLRHPGEWWHFSWGDQLWAWICQENNPGSPAIARYGRFRP